MRLENIAIDAVNPVRVADFLEAALGTERLTTAQCQGDGAAVAVVGS